MDKTIRKITNQRSNRQKPTAIGEASLRRNGSKQPTSTASLSIGRKASCRMEKDQRDLLRVFNDRKVKYLVVGGYAVSHFTEPRATKDLDIFIDTSDAN